MTSIPPRQLAYLLDISQSARAIQSYVAGQAIEQFRADGKTQDAVLRRLLVIGEAAAQLSPETRAMFPSIPFAKIVGRRNRVVHDYGSVDVEIVWSIVQDQLPAILRDLEPHIG